MPVNWSYLDYWGKSLQRELLLKLVNLDFDFQLNATEFIEKHHQKEKSLKERHVDIQVLILKTVYISNCLIEMFF